MLNIYEVLDDSAKDDIKKLSSEEKEIYDWVIKHILIKSPHNPNKRDSFYTIHEKNDIKKNVC